MASESAKNLRVLVVGGAGYVGGATCAWLKDRGHFVWVLDDLSTGHRDRLVADGFTFGKAGDEETVAELLSKHRFDGVMHFAAKSLVSESVEKPDLYRRNNVIETQALVRAMLKSGIKRLVFSSTCAIFGDPGTENISEATPKNPISPYGQTKLEAETHFRKMAESDGLQSISLRYFNAAGAEPGLRTGEIHNPETHLIPNTLNAAWESRPVSVFGDDYPTPDGTCIRDYIHVTDLAQAHEAALFRLMEMPAESGVAEGYNLGSTHGYSVLEIIAACQKVTGKKIDVERKPRRPGDPPRLVADSTSARKTLGFEPRESLESIVGSAWAWEKTRRKPRPAVFLDRDGTLNEDPGYLSQPEQMNLYPGVGEALSQLKKEGYLLVVVSNQSGVARGLIEEKALPKIHARLDELLARNGTMIDRYELCLHSPDQNCECRKPKPQLLQEAARALNLDLKKSFMIGDKVTDVEAGTAAGTRGSILVLTGSGKEHEKKALGKASYIAGDLNAAARWILDQPV